MDSSIIQISIRDAAAGVVVVVVGMDDSSKITLVLSTGYIMCQIQVFPLKHFVGRRRRCCCCNKNVFFVITKVDVGNSSRSSIVFIRVMLYE
jgi:hypothetical protein